MDSKIFMEQFKSITDRAIKDLVTMNIPISDVIAFSLYDLGELVENGGENAAKCLKNNEQMKFSCIQKIADSLYHLSREDNSNKRHIIANKGLSNVVTLLLYALLEHEIFE